MKTFRLLLCCGVLAGCSRGAGSTLPVANASFARQPAHAAVGFKTLYEFRGKPDGALPEGGLTYVDGAFYGATHEGGDGYYRGNGTVFKIAPSGSETVLHKFGSGLDGQLPLAGLIYVDGALYGTTQYGGNYGTVYKITLSGSESVIYSFKGGPNDGAYPGARLTNVSGTLYGTTTNGAGGSGTVFKVSTTGTESVIHKFRGAPSDGKWPKAELIDVNGVLYGTTNSGGANNVGTIFKITPSGTESIVYNFKGGSEGIGPNAALLYSNGALYGTTFGGGHAGGENGQGCGTVFKVTLSGTETILYRFKGSANADGDNPDAPLINVNGALYGKTRNGGSSLGLHVGTIFKVTMSGTVTHYEFQTGMDPWTAGLTEVSGVLYGMTSAGGLTYNAGTLFKISSLVL